LTGGSASTPALFFTGDANTGIFSPAADTIAFAEGGVESARIDSSGRLLVGTTTATANGGVLELSGGITFPATAVAASNANTLDDYEEGTWTPTVGGTATYTEREGNYVKIGRLVYARCSMTVSSIGSGSTTTISGLPFTCYTTVAGTGGQLYVGFYANLAANCIFVAGYVGSNSTSVIFTKSSSSSANIDNSPAIFGNSSRVDFTLIYQV
jgi:hypothetical protein